MIQWVNTTHTLTHTHTHTHTHSHSHSYSRTHSLSHSLCESLGVARVHLKTGFPFVHGNGVAFGSGAVGECTLVNACGMVVAGRRDAAKAMQTGCRKWCKLRAAAHCIACCMRKHRLYICMKKIHGVALDSERASWPVSYTHLTLPTICSV